KYLHLKKNSVSAVNSKIRDCVTKHGDEGGFTGADSEMESNPLHVYAGQRIALTGDVGISMFPHIHFYVQLPASGGSVNHPPVKFKDDDVSGHDGQCWSMRKYESSNMDLGAVQVPPPAAGGPP